MDSNVLISYAIKYDGDYNKILSAISKKEDIEKIECQNCFTIFDDIYPKELLELKYPPFVLFYKGDLSLLSKKKVSVVGSRIPCNYAIKSTIDLVKSLNNYVIVSGLAKGIDAIAHDNASNTIGIIGCGIDYVYPYCNMHLYKKLEKQGLILSEYPNSIKPLAYHFPFRNRIIAALSKTVYIMQSSLKSGTMTTVSQALELGREIKVLPYDIYCKEGLNNNHLIQEGASIIEYDEIAN